MNKNFIIFRIKNNNKEMDNHWNIKIWRIKRRIRWMYVILDLRSSCSWLQGFSYSVTQINVDIELVTCYKLPVWWYGVFKRWSLILCNFPEYRRFRGSSCSRRHGESRLFIGVKAGAPHPHQISDRRESGGFIICLSSLMWDWVLMCEGASWLTAPCVVQRESKQKCLVTRRQA